MRQFIEIIAAAHIAESDILATLTLAFDKRQKSRLRAVLDNGEEVGLSLPRGQVLRNGQLLQAEDGSLVRVCAATEAVSTATATDATGLARACYHLGNRHVAVQVGDGWLRYLRDHVLDDMLIQHGLKIIHEQAPFEPEDGAYAHHHD